LMTITTTIAIATGTMPAVQANPAAAHSSNASGWVNCAASSCGQRRPPRRLSSFGPWTISRRSASRSESPSGLERRSRSSSSTRSVGWKPGRAPASGRSATRGPTRRPRARTSAIRRRKAWIKPGSPRSAPHPPDAPDALRASPQPYFVGPTS
jgi:hypothetical protein